MVKDHIVVKQQILAVLLGASLRQVCEITFLISYTPRQDENLGLAWPFD